MTSLMHQQVPICYKIIALRLPEELNNIIIEGLIEGKRTVLDNSVTRILYNIFVIINNLSYYKPDLQIEKKITQKRSRKVNSN